MRKQILFLTSAILIWAACLYLISRPEPQLEVIFFDVGQGDSIYIETVKDFQVLIDGGPSSAVLEKLGREMPLHDKIIELVILTHPDSDHLAGLLDVLEKYEIKNILWSGAVKDTAEFKEWERVIKEEEADIIIARAGQKIILRKNPEISLSVIYPFKSLEGQSLKDLNESSVVVRLAFKDKSFLFTGDISFDAETKLIESYGEDLSADILKVAHHGSKYSTGSNFLFAVSPKTAVISAGENNWGHPSEETLQRLKDSGINILITKEKGDIEFNF